MKVVVLLALTMALTGCGFEVVDTGYRGVLTHFGKVQGEALDEGLHFYNPLTEDIIEMKVMETKIQELTECFTKDTQNVKITFAMTYYPDKTKIHQMYQQFGVRWDDIVVKQVVLGSIKDVVGQYNADDLVSKREVAKQAAQKEISVNLKERNVIVTRLDFVNLDFDDNYEKAVEEKVVAIQNAAKEKNKTVEIQEIAKQTIETAKAEAEAMRIKSAALSQNKGLVQFEAVKRWDGKLPQYMFGSTIPMINLDKVKAE